MDVDGHEHVSLGNKVTMLMRFSSSHYSECVKLANFVVFNYVSDTLHLCELT